MGDGAGRRTKIARAAVVRTIVALLAGSRIDQPVAAQRQGTVAVAHGALPGGVALLTGVEDAVAAHFETTRRGAAVATDLVAVVALLAGIEDAIATDLELTLRGAAVAADLVTVVALLTGSRIDQPVTAQRKGTVAVAQGTLPGEVALLAGVEDAVAAHFQTTLRGAAVAADLVAVVALLAGVEDAIATDLELTLRGAAVAADLVTVVALLAGSRIDQPVAAQRQGAVDVAHGARSGGVALLAGVEDAVAADLELTRRGAAVAADLVAVVALLAGVEDAIAALRESARAVTAVAVEVRRTRVRSMRSCDSADGSAPCSVQSRRAKSS